MCITYLLQLIFIRFYYIHMYCLFRSLMMEILPVKEYSFIQNHWTLGFFINLHLMYVYICYLTCRGDFVGEFGTLLVELVLFSGPDFLAHIPRWCFTELVDCFCKSFMSLGRVSRLDRCLELFVSGLELLVSRLKLLVSRLELLVSRLELFMGNFNFKRSRD